MKQLLLISAVMAMACVGTASAFLFQFNFNNFCGQPCARVERFGVLSSARTLAFGTHSTGTTTRQTITLYNTGTAAINDLSQGTYSSAVFSAATSATNPCGAVLAAKSNCNMDVRFSPTAAQSYSATAVVLSNQLENYMFTVTGTGVAASRTFVVNQNFEGAGYDNGEIWTASGTANPDYTTTVLRGSQSLSLLNAFSYVQSPSFNPMPVFYMRMMFRITALPTATKAILILMDGTTDVTYLNLTSTGYLSIANGSAVANSDISISTNNTYYIWVYFTRSSSGGNAGIYISTNSTKPTGVTVSGGTSSHSITSVKLYTSFASSYHIYDQILIDSSDIGSGDIPQ